MMKRLQLAASKFDPQKMGQTILSALRLRALQKVTRNGVFFARVQLADVVNRFPTVVSTRRALQPLYGSAGIDLQVSAFDKHRNCRGWVANLRGSVNDKSGATVADFEVDIDTFSGTITVYEV
jgi:hypothetical protein